ncbi:MAG: 2-dehydropantoate 2-reductase [Deltaproteobacteria bacterium]|nr:2-dehydropantoate 2-reductase [Deltaproteobacteria bacterium]
MKIVIVGPGALGSLFAAALAAGTDSEVWLLDKDVERAAQVHGKLLLTKGEQEFCRFVSASGEAEKIGAADLVLLCVKSRDVAAALQAASPLFTEKTMFIAFQNGISHLDTLARVKLPVPPVIGVTAMGATLLRPGHVCYGGQGLTRIGFLSPAGAEKKERLAEIAELFNRAGLPTQQVANILDYVWAKLLVNVGINALTALHDCANGDLLVIDGARDKLVAAVTEGMVVARALGIHLPEDPVSGTLAVCRATAGNISSMLQDVRRGRATEIGAINGALIDKANELGIDVPVNRELVAGVRAIEGGYPRKESRVLCPDRL